MNDDAVAPVVAAMLVLAVIVTAFSAWNAILLPSLKEQSEMVQDREVQQAFSRFSSDIVDAVSLRRDLTFSEPLPLGGGGILFSPLTSSGTLRVEGEPVPLYRILITEGATPERIAEGRMIRFSYQPVGDFWLDQGYTWQYGFVNVTKGSSRTGTGIPMITTPLAFASMDDVYRKKSIQDFANSLVVVEAEPWYNSTGNCSRITITSVTFNREPGSSYLSSNGIGILELTAESTSPSVFGVEGISSPDSLAIRVNRSENKPFSLGLYERVNESFSEIAATYRYNIAHSFQEAPFPAYYNETSLAPVPGMLPFTVTHRHIAINVSVAG